MTELARRAGQTKVEPANVETELAQRRRSGIARGELVTLPVIGEVWIELPGVETTAEIDAAVFAEMDRLKLAPTPINGLTYAGERDARILAWAVRHPERRGERLGTLDQWRGKTDPVLVDSDLLSACALVYNDVRERRNPIGLPTLTEEDFTRIRLAIEKKNPMSLLEFGVAMLAIYLLTMDSRPARSPTPESSSGQSSPASS